MKREPRVIGMTGATGVLGGDWLRATLAHDPEVRVVALARDPAAALRSHSLRALTEFQRQRIQWVKADLGRLSLTAGDRERLARVTEGWWHFAAATTLSRDPAAAALAHAVNAEGTRRLLDEVIAAGTGAPFYHISTAYVAGRFAGPLLEVPHPARDFHNPYERSKAMAEEHVLRFFCAGGRGAIFRPSIVLGRGTTDGHQFVGLCRRAITLARRQGETDLVLRLPATAALNLVPLEWVTACLRALADAEWAAHPIYHLTAPSNVSLKELIAAVESRAPLRLRVTFAPDAAPAALPPAARLVDRVLEEVKDYLLTVRTFDRRRLERALPPELQQPPCPRRAWLRALLPEDAPALAGAGID